MKVYCDKKNRSFIYIEKEATPEFWDKHWDTKDFKEVIEREKNNRFVLRTLTKYLPHSKGKILEGGCKRAIYMSPLKGLKAKLGLYKEFSGEEKGNFYQLVLSSEKIIKDFQARDFKLLEKKPINGLRGLCDDIGIFKPQLNNGYDSHKKRIWIKGFIFILNEVLAFLGMEHLMFFVFWNMTQD